MKSRFEDSSFSEIIEKLDEEIWELKEEFLDKKLNIEFVINEIGDCAAVLAGLLAKIEEIKDDE